MKRKNLDFIGFPNYEVDTDGEIYNIKSKIKLGKRYDNYGYRRVILYNKGYNKSLFVHRIVALAFIPNNDNKPCIDHINTKRDDNRVENLRWCTIKENTNNILTKKHLSDSLKGKKSHWRGRNLPLEIINKLKKPIIQYEKDGTFVKEWDGAIDAQRTIGYRASSITACCKGRQKSAYGYVFKYKEKNNEE